MNAYFYFAIILGVALIAKAIFMNDLVGGALALLAFWFAYNLYQSRMNHHPKVNRDRCTEDFTGTITDITWSSFRFNTEKTFNVTVEYKGISKVFKQLPPNFTSQFSVGDTISVQANPDNTKESYLNY
ncbi:hypothetical protein CBF23_006125 [Marinomonas agarivorans]|nr:hypothetical protein CBF23_006125 [Marinomonas agarivorans]